MTRRVWSQPRVTNCPVIAVAPQAKTRLENSLKTILYATDFSDESRAVHNPEQPIKVGELRPRLSPLQGHELLAKGQALQEEG